MWRSRNTTLEAGFWPACVALLTTPIAFQIVWESLNYWRRVALFFLHSHPTNRAELQVWAVLFPVWFAFNLNTGYASISKEARRDISAGKGVEWDGKMEEHPNHFAVKRALTNRGLGMWFPIVRPTLLVVTFTWPFVAPFCSLASDCAFLSTWLVLLRRPDLVTMTKTMRCQFGRQPSMREAEGMNTEMLHVGVETKLRLLDPDTYKLIALKPALVDVLSRVGVPVAQVVDIRRPRSELPPFPWFAKPHRDAYGTDVRRVESQEEADCLRVDRDFVQVCLENHPSLRPSLGENVATVRIFTGCTNDEGTQARFLDACLQVPLLGSINSNVSAGNISVEIDLETGTLGFGAKFDKKAHYLPPLTMRRVPGRDVDFTGVVLPNFHEAVRQCVNAHQSVLSRACYLGWDVALTPEGVSVIECNTFCSTGVFGNSLHRLKNGELADLLLSHIQNKDVWVKMM